MMNREIEFRGKARMTIDELNDIGLSSNNGWVYGNLIQSSGLTFIVGGVVDWCDEYLAHEWWVQVDPDTVGQYTGLKDKHGTKIFEGDIVAYSDGEESFIAVVEWDYWSWYLKGVTPVDNFSFDDMADKEKAECIVTGNVYENPELLNN